MHVKKNDDSNTWEVFVYASDYTGKKKLKHKRGFKTKREALKWGEQFKFQQESNLDMDFQAFWELYRADMSQRLRENTFRTKDYIVELKILPYFGKRKIADIKAADIRKWQNQIMKEGYAPTYLKTINNQLSAIFNYAARYYDLPKNPCVQAGSMGKSQASSMDFWTQEEFGLFVECVKDKPVSYMAFRTLFWTGIRIGELLALTLGDFSAKDKTININKSLQRIDGRDVITEPKTEKSKRVIALPDFLVEEMKDYVNRLYGMMPGDRLFMVTKAYLEHEMSRGVALSGVKKIRLHDLRHSHASLLISKLGAQPLMVAERLGHEKIQTTLNTYSHLYPDQARNLADQLNLLNDGNTGQEDTDNARET
ncbi:MAG: site-specific integrase [Lachnospiraceae bacterium]|nr:site-specific integrase [Lachnospiraceae bacterium]